MEGDALVASEDPISLERAVETHNVDAFIAALLVARGESIRKILSVKENIPFIKAVLLANKATGQYTQVFWDLFTASMVQPSRVEFVQIFLEMDFPEGRQPTHLRQIVTATPETHDTLLYNEDALHLVLEKFKDLIVEKQYVWDAAKFGTRRMFFALWIRLLTQYKTNKTTKTDRISEIGEIFVQAAQRTTRTIGAVAKLLRAFNRPPFSMIDAAMEKSAALPAHRTVYDELVNEIAIELANNDVVMQIAMQAVYMSRDETKQNWYLGRINLGNALEMALGTPAQNQSAYPSPCDRETILWLASKGARATNSTGTFLSDFDERWRLEADDLRLILEHMNRLTEADIQRALGVAEYEQNENVLQWLKGLLNQVPAWRERLQRQEERLQRQEDAHFKRPYPEWVWRDDFAANSLRERSVMLRHLGRGLYVRTMAQSDTEDEAEDNADDLDDDAEWDDFAGRMRQSRPRALSVGSNRSYSLGDEGQALKRARRHARQMQNGLHALGGGVGGWSVNREVQTSENRPDGHVGPWPVESGRWNAGEAGGGEGVGGGGGGVGGWDPYSLSPPTRWMRQYDLLGRGGGGSGRGGGDTTNI